MRSLPAWDRDILAADLGGVAGREGRSARRRTTCRGRCARGRFRRIGRLEPALASPGTLSNEMIVTSNSRKRRWFLWTFSAGAVSTRHTAAICVCWLFFEGSPRGGASGPDEKRRSAEAESGRSTGCLHDGILARGAGTLRAMFLAFYIVGLPERREVDPLNALTKTRKAEAANYLFCTIEPNVGGTAVARRAARAARQDREDVRFDHPRDVRVRGHRRPFSWKGAS